MLPPVNAWQTSTAFERRTSTMRTVWRHGHLAR